MKKISFIYLPALFFIYVTTEAILKLFHSSICASTGCLLADSLLRFDSIYLNFIGVLDAILILVAGVLSYNRKINEKIFYVILISSLLFETIMLGYQYWASPEMCKFCMGVYTFLVIITLLSTRKYFIMVIPALLAVIVSLSFLAVPKSKPFTVTDGNYLIQSPTCPHCKKVKSYLKEHNINFRKLSIDDIEARNFATFLNFKTIPILVIKDGQTVNIINGDKNIIEFFNKKDEKNNIVVEESAVVGDETISTIDLLSQNEDEGDEGCGFATIEKIDTNCSK